MGEENCGRPEKSIVRKKMIIKRDIYLKKLIDAQNNGMIKVITGIRRSGKSFLLFEIFYQYLLSSGTKKDHIIKIALDDRMNMKYRDPDFLCDYVHAQIKDNDMYYVLLDEVQFVPEFEDVLNSFLHIKNVDTYVTGSNARFLSKDVITEFRGRGWQIHINPLSFSEFMQVYNGSIENGYKEYSLFGGLPKLFELKNDIEKISYLKEIFEETYLKDIIERNNVLNDDELNELLDFLSSSIGSLTNPQKLSNTFDSVKHVKIHHQTIKKYIDYFIDSFIISSAKRYNINGKTYINTPLKYYFTDIGLRNARINFREPEEQKIMENIVYNELTNRGYNVDVGVVELYEPNSVGKSVLKQTEVDFVCNIGDKRYYVQVAYMIDSEEKLNQEQKSLLHINDFFKRIIIVKDNIKPHYNEDGVYMMGLYDFLLNQDSFDF